MQNGQKRKENTAASSSAVKRRRQDDGPSQDAGSFEEELASLQQSTDPSSKWARPQVPAFDPAKEAIVFQQLEVDHYIGELS